MSSEPIFSSSYTIQYHVTQQSVAAKIKHILHIWELVPTACGQDNLLYQINYEVQEESSVHRIINQLLGAAGAQQLSSYQFEKLQGKLRINPNPTLRLPASQYSQKLATDGEKL
ncbi:MAG: hypothetical protein ACO3NK_05430 [Prochlorotrichaceae cyanobacterium]